MERRGLYEYLGGRDIVRHIRGFANVVPSMLELDTNDLLEEIGQLGYDPDQVLTQLVAQLTEENKIRRMAQAYRPVYSELDSIASAGNWNMQLIEDGVILTVWTDASADRMRAWCSMLNQIVTRDQAMSQGVSSGQYRRVTQISVSLHDEGDGEWTINVILPIPYNLYAAIIYLDSQGRQEEIEVSYTSYWVDKAEVI